MIAPEVGVPSEATLPGERFEAVDDPRAARASRSARLLFRLDLFFTAHRIWWAGLVLILVAFPISIASYTSRFSFSSDDVAIQNMLQAIQGGERFSPSTGSATWLLKVPVYLLVDLVLPNGTLNIGVSIFLCDLPLILGVLVLARMLVDRIAPDDRRAMLGAVLIGACFFCALAPQFDVLMETNARNGEIGIALLIGYLLTRVLDDPRMTRGWIIGALTVVIIGLALLVVDDDLWLYVFLPVAGITVVVAWIRSRTSLRLACASLAALVAGCGAGVFLLGRLQAAGLTISQNFNSTLINATDLGANVGGAIGAVMQNFDADVWGQAPNAAVLPSAVQFVFGLVCLALSVVAILRIVTQPDSFRLFLAVGIAVDVLLDVMTGNASVVLNFRYVLIAAVFSLLLAVLGLADLASGSFRISAGTVTATRVRRLAVAAGVLCALFGVVLNVATTVQGATGAIPSQQARTREVVRVVESAGLTVGLAQYWDAATTSYFSGRRVRVAPLQCTPSGAGRNGFLVNYQDALLSAPRMFVLTSAVNGCSAAVIEKTYGAPARTIALKSSDDAVLVYDRRLR